jgi:hypothetical protein
MNLEFRTITRYFNTHTSGIDIIVAEEGVSTDIEALDSIHFDVDAWNVNTRISSIRP